MIKIWPICCFSDELDDRVVMFEVIDEAQKVEVTGSDLFSWLKSNIAASSYMRLKSAVAE